MHVFEIYFLVFFMMQFEIHYFIIDLLDTLGVFVLSISIDSVWLSFTRYQYRKVNCWYQTSMNDAFKCVFVYLGCFR